jgi:hypothetical protein
MPAPEARPPGRHLHPRWDEVAERAATDEAFRRGLLDDPARTLRDTLGLALPAGYRVRFVERPSDLDALVVLPDRRRDDLSDDELDAVAGGEDGWSTEPSPPPPPPPPPPS